MSKFHRYCSCITCHAEMTIQNIGNHFEKAHVLRNEPHLVTNKCFQCGEETNNPKFCCRSCSVTYSNSVRDYSLSPSGRTDTKEIREEKRSERNSRRKMGIVENNGNPYCRVSACVICDKNHCRTGKTCSSECYRKYASKQITGKTGGWRNFGGNGKKGIYEGILYQSSWELAWIVYHLDHKIEFRRCTEFFNYEFGGKERKYYPDFYLTNTSEYVEVKGYWSDITEAKIKSISDRGYKISVIGSNEIKSFLDYMKTRASSR